MKAATILSLASVALASLAVEKRACAGNNCNRAITGNRDGLTPSSIRSADCSSYLATTVAGSVVTITVTVDEEQVAASTSNKAKRATSTLATNTTPAPHKVPDYATHACDAAQYASACGCYGITGVTVTAAVSTVTTTTTVDYCEDL